jgi:transcriptional regulator
MTERETLEFIQEFPFGMLISNDESGLQTTHIPFYLIEQSDKLYLHTHLSAVNTQGNALDQKEILVVFHGPNAYISSSWYNHPNVSTWNYLAVHVKGKSRIMETQELIASLSRLTDPYLKIFRGIVPPLIGIDISPILGFILLQCIMQIVSNVGISSN